MTNSSALTKDGLSLRRKVTTMARIPQRKPRSTFLRGKKRQKLPYRRETSHVSRKLRPSSIDSRSTYRLTQLRTGLMLRSTCPIYRHNRSETKLRTVEIDSGNSLSMGSAPGSSHSDK